MIAFHMASFIHTSPEMRTAYKRHVKPDAFFARLLFVG